MDADIEELLDQLKNVRVDTRGTVGTIKQTEDRRSCERCGSTLRSSNTTVVCTGCDAMLSHNLTYGDFNMGPMRHGPVASQLYTSSSLSWCTYNSMRTPLRTCTMSSRDRSLHSKVSELRSRVMNQVSPDVCRVCEHMYKIVTDSPHMAGTRRRGLLEGTLYIASSACHSPISPGEIALMFETELKVVESGIKRIQNVVQARHHESGSMEYVTRYLCNNGHADDKGLGRAYVQAIEMSDLLVSARPPVIAAVALALVYDHKGYDRGKQHARELSGVSDTTIRKNLKVLNPSISEIKGCVEKIVAGEHF